MERQWRCVWIWNAVQAAREDCGEIVSEKMLYCAHSPTNRLSPQRQTACWEKEWRSDGGILVLVASDRAHVRLSERLFKCKTRSETLFYSPSKLCQKPQSVWSFTWLAKILCSILVLFYLAHCYFDSFHFKNIKSIANTTLALEQHVMQNNGALWSIMFGIIQKYWLTSDKSKIKRFEHGSTFSRIAANRDMEKQAC